MYIKSLYGQLYRKYPFYPKSNANSIKKNVLISFHQYIAVASSHMLFMYLFQRTLESTGFVPTQKSLPKRLSQAVLLTTV